MTRPGKAARERAAEQLSQLGTDAELGLAEEVNAEAITDSHLSERFAAEVLQSSHCWVLGLGWMAWRGNRWSSASAQEIRELARVWVLGEYAAFLYERKQQEIATRSKEWLRQLSNNHIRAIVTQAEGIVLRDAADFDAHPDLLNCANGVVDLRTSELMPHDPALMLTKSTEVGYVRGATQPDWDKALTALPPEVRPWYQIRIGQGATGHMPPDDAVLINQGGGENGKTTVLQGIRHALGDYYVQVPVKALYGDPGQHDTVLMPFRGARIAALEETPEEGHLNVQQVKAITTPQIRARLMRRDYVEFNTTHTTLVNTNPEPAVENADHGTWRRLILVRWPYTYLKHGQEKKLPTHQDGDPGLRDRIIAGQQGQHEAVLAWLVDGARRWYEGGRVMPGLPERVHADTDEWRGRANLIYGFAQEHLEPSPDHHIIADELYQFFDSAIRGNGHKRWAKETFFKRLKEYCSAAGWDVEKKYTKRRMDRISRAPAEVLLPPKDSYQAWHGIRFRPESPWQADAPDQVAGRADRPVSADDAHVSEVSIQSGTSYPARA